MGKAKINTDEAARVRGRGAGESERAAEERCARRTAVDDRAISAKLDTRAPAEAERRPEGAGAGEGASIDTSTANGRLVFGIFAGLAEFERALIIEKTKAGLAAARARGRNGGAPFKMTPAKLLEQAAMGKPETKIADFCTELGISRQTLYRFVGPNGELRSDGERLLQRRTTFAK